MPITSLFGMENRYQLWSFTIPSKLVIMTLENALFMAYEGIDIDIITPFMEY